MSRKTKKQRPEMEEPQPEQPVPGTEPQTESSTGAAAEAEEPAGPETLESLRAERDQYLDRWQRAQADYQNLKRRSMTDFEAMLRRTMQPLLENVLLVVDHLEMALAAPTTTEEAKNLAQGVAMTRDQLLRALEEERVVAISGEGEFDPALHQAVASVEDSDAAPGTIVDTVRRGYTWRDSVLRHAQVRVAAGEPERAGGENESEDPDQPGPITGEDPDS